MFFFSDEIIKSRSWMLSISVVLAVVIGVVGWQGKDSQEMAAEIPNALTDLLRGKPTDGIYEALRKEHCLSPAGIERRAQVLAVIAKADEEVRRRQERGMVGGTREYDIVDALIRGGYLNARAGELLNTITYKPQPFASPQLPPVPSKGQASSQLPKENQISTAQFKLLTQSRGFLFQFVCNGKSKQVTIPRDWLIPPQEEKDEEFNYVSSFHYDKEVASFPIGNGQTGLHISSYAIQEEGSAQAASGRDIFLIFDPASSGVFRRGIERGVTKQRVRSQGCPAASAEKYLLADVDGDGLIDIGVVKEELQCVQSTKRQDVDLIVGPFYKQDPVVWYVFKEKAWKLEPSFSGKLPEHYQELPFIGIEESPVDYVGCTLWKTCDRAKWPTGEK